MIFATATKIPVNPYCDWVKPAFTGKKVGVNETDQKADIHQYRGYDTLLPDLRHSVRLTLNYSVFCNDVKI